MSLGVPEGNTPSIALILGHPATSFKKSIKRQFANINTIDENIQKVLQKCQEKHVQ
jgi:hypothetical protein